ncbi:hypothetical protein KKH96_00470 [Patescibacteria group bacterium]|nr:hypothetical protein [Patescibacteria group bacterium]
MNKKFIIKNVANFRDNYLADYINQYIKNDNFYNLGWGNLNEKMVELYVKSFAILIVFEGEGAIAVGQEAKNFFRRKYNYGYYGSTIYAADNAEEYTREVNFLNGSCGKF